MKQSSPSQPRSKLLPFLFLLTFLFFLLEVFVHLTTTKGTLIIYALLQDHLIHVPLNVIWPELVFLSAQLILYVTYTLLIWGVARLVASLFHLSWDRTCRLGFCLWFIASVTVLLANQVYYPDSSFAGITSVIIPPLLANLLLWSGVGLLVACMILALASLLKVLWQKSPIINLAFILFCGASYALFMDFGKAAIAQTVQQVESQQPNVIILGLDSVREDYTDFGGYQGGEKITPYLDHFLHKATFFNHAFTPIARTYPSWAAILTGQYPVNNGVRNNLESQSHLQLNNALGKVLQRHGYYTVYATDDRRFSNVSHKYGFNRLIGPPEGANDFVLGSSNDFPLSNLVVNTKLGQYLFPYSYGNRAAATIYDPHSFNNMVEQKLLNSPHNKPLFLAIHFCLPHWPYTWSKRTYSSIMLPVGLYTQSIKRVDRQAHQFIEFLRRHHYLDHAIVIVLSDHGEGLLKPHDKVTSKAGYIPGPDSDKHVFQNLSFQAVAAGYNFDTSYGHGTDVLSLVQYNTVLAFKTFGLKLANQPRMVQQRVSLIDLEPTILSMLDLKPPETDGLSLTPYLYDKQLPQWKARPIFLETGFTPKRTAPQKHQELDIRGIALKGAKLFKILPNDKLVVKQSMRPEELANKQRAELYKNWELALYPGNNSRRTPALVNLKTGQWTDDLTTPFAKQAPLKLMLSKMKALYGQEVDQYYPYIDHSQESL